MEGDEEGEFMFRWEKRYGNRLCNEKQGNERETKENKGRTGSGFGSSTDRGGGKGRKRLEEKRSWRRKEMEEEVR